MGKIGKQEEMNSLLMKLKYIIWKKLNLILVIL